MRIVCSKIFAADGADGFFRAIKYPLIQEDIPIKGRENESILIAGAVRISFIQYTAIGSAKKKKAAVIITLISAVSKKDFLTMRFTDLALPHTSSSATRRVTAVESPEVAKQEASRYTDITSE